MPQATPKQEEERMSLKIDGGACAVYQIPCLRESTKGTAGPLPGTPRCSAIVGREGQENLTLATVDIWTHPPVLESGRSNQDHQFRFGRRWKGERSVGDGPYIVVLDPVYSPGKIQEWSAVSHITSPMTFQRGTPVDKVSVSPVSQEKK